jgi:mRNA interferase MazF
MVARGAKDAASTSAIKRGTVWWADLPEPRGSEPGYRRPVLILQTDDFNRSQIRTVVVVVLTSNLTLADAPGNVLLTTRETGLPKESVANVAQVVTLDKTVLTEPLRRVPAPVLHTIEQGVRLVLGL